MAITMKSLNEVLRPVKKALLSVTDNTGHYKAIDATKSHIIYAEDSGTGLMADNVITAQSIEGTIDLYQLGKDNLFDKVQEALNTYQIAFRLNSVQYESDEKRNFIHFEWVFEVS